MTIHGIYVGTMLVTAIAALVQEWAPIKWPELQHEAKGGALRLDGALVLAILMGVAFVVTVTVPVIGLRALLVLVLSRPIEHLLASRRPT